MPRILLTHTPEMRRNYYAERPLAALRQHGKVILHEDAETLSGRRLIEAARGCQFIVADRATAGPAEVFEACPDLVAFLRVAVDISTIDVPAASRAGVLVTQATPGFVAYASVPAKLAADDTRSGVLGCVSKKLGWRPSRCSSAVAFSSVRRKAAIAAGFSPAFAANSCPSRSASRSWSRPYDAMSPAPAVCPS